MISDQCVDINLLTLYLLHHKDHLPTSIFIMPSVFKPISVHLLLLSSRSLSLPSPMFKCCPGWVPILHHPFTQMIQSYEPQHGLLVHYSGLHWCTSLPHPQHFQFKALVFSFLLQFSFLFYKSPLTSCLNHVKWSEVYCHEVLMQWKSCLQQHPRHTDPDKHRKV